jgi:S1-C subfamily serine protease
MAAATPQPPGWYGFGFNRHVEPKAAVSQWLYIHRVETGGPAAKAGLRVQDVVVGLNDRPLSFVTDKAALQFFATRKPGDVLRLTILRGRVRLPITIRAANLPPDRAEQWRRNYELAKEREAGQ